MFHYYNVRFKRSCTWCLGVFITLCLWFNTYASEYVTVSDMYDNLAIVECPKYLNIRSKPSTDAEVVGIICDGGGCDVVKEGDSWCAIQSGQIFGYVLKEYLILGEDAIQRAEETAVLMCRFDSIGRVFSKTDNKSEVCDKPVTGTVYDILYESNGWIALDMLGWTGYVQDDGSVTKFYGLRSATRTTDLESVSQLRKDIVNYAMTFLGNAYVWGGNDPNTGADCSGFVRYVYSKKAPDVYLPRVSYEQCYYGEPVTSLGMSPGDLVFYAYSNGRVHHVAMYIGNGTIIHAASKRQGIILSQWNYQAPKYIRKLLKE